MRKFNGMYVIGIDHGYPLHCTVSGKRKSTTQICVAGENSPAIHKNSTGNNKVFVDIHSATNWVNDFKHSTSPQNDILRKQAGTGHSLKD